jgi:hypothetical protein
MPTPAQSYADAIASQMTSLSSVEATQPSPWTNFFGAVSCTVTREGKAELTLNNVSQSVSPDEILSLADWIIATFR